LRRRSTRFDNELKADLETHGDGHYLDMRISEDPDLIAEDGFHPGPGVYIEWGRRAADVIARQARVQQGMEHPG
jgi:lysophospholipase L1-like esterase